MCDKPNLSIAEQDMNTDRAVLDLLIYEDSQRPWSVEEVRREIGSDAEDSLARLHGGGLVHRHDGFAWPTRAALLAHRLSS